MAKQGMKRPNDTHTKPRNSVSPVPEIKGKAKHGHVQAKPMNESAESDVKIYNAAQKKSEKPIRAGIYPVVDTDLARDNIENDIPAADLQDL